MSQRAMKPAKGNGGKQFPPEADGEFDIVEQREIDALREQLKKRFGIGEGKLKSMDVIPAR